MSLVEEVVVRKFTESEKVEVWVTSWQDVPRHNTQRFATQINGSGAGRLAFANRAERHI